MYVSESIKELLRDMLLESDYYFVLAEIEDAYDTGYYDGYRNGYIECRNNLL